jgi:hypothetical protein
MQSLSGAQAEAGMMPGAAHRLTNEQAFRQRAPVVRAGRPNGEHRPAAPGEQHIFAADVPGQHLPFRQFGRGNPKRQIRPGNVRL